ncbi:MAG: phnC [Frankiales bacterium]|nr:phnC [Frankiales bacterium]
MSAALAVEGLCHAYDGVPVLRDVSFTVAPGEVVAVVGPSGAGKTTLFRCLTRLTRADAGAVRLFDVDLQHVEGTALRQARRDLGLVFQGFNLVRRLTATQNVLVGRLAETPAWRVLLRRPSAADDALAAACLQRVGLLPFAHTRADRLSGGQQQRVAIARALASRARVVIADEPVASLDPSSAADVLTALRSLATDDGRAVVCSLHQVDLVAGFADRVVGLREGRVVLDVPVERFDPARARALYARSLDELDHHPEPLAPERTPGRP